MGKVPELLCPVGGKDTLGAAILGGADAVYFGAREFNARMNAKNFDEKSIPEAVSRCHEKGVRVYVTLNTLLTDRLLPRALSLVSSLYEAGVDALIVADLGLANLIRSSFPDFELHASTQVSGHNALAARELADLGFSRMVVAREVDRENLRRLVDASPIEIELFVHGALCASHSGQCLMSSMIGDRSGNRGECAQPCRLPYNGTYPLSLKDLTLASHVPQILDLGVASLKIEGRMKSPAYVYTVTRIWRRLLDEGRSATPKELAQLSGAFSRTGFTDGYFLNQKNETMLGVRTEKDKGITERLRVSYRESKRSAPPIEIQREKKGTKEIVLPPKEKTPFTRSARFFKPEQIPDTDFFREIYLPLSVFDGKKANGVVLPPVIFDGEREKVREQLVRAVKMGAQHVLIGNIGHLSLTEGLDVTLHGDFRLNVTNSVSLHSYPSLSDVILSPELNLAQMRDMRGGKRVIVYGRIPLMLLERRVGVRSLRDRRGATFPVIREGERDMVLNCVPFYMLDKSLDLKEKGLVSQHYIFTTETKEEIIQILEAAKEKKAPTFPVKRIK